MPRSKFPLTSEQRAEISRRNGARSKGPTSAAGKERVSRNAVKHGLASHKHIVLDDEMPQSYDELLQIYLDRFAPTDGVEEELVHHMAEAAWRIRRSDCLETAAFNCSRSDAEAIAEEHYAEPGLQEIAYLAWQEARTTLESIHRYAARAHRVHNTALANLRLLHKWKADPQVRAGSPDPASGADLRSAERSPDRSNPETPEPPQPTETKSDVPQVPEMPNKPKVHPEITTERSNSCQAEPSGICDPPVASSDPSVP